MCKKLDIYLGLFLKSFESFMLNHLAQWQLQSKEKRDSVYCTFFSNFLLSDSKYCSLAGIVLENLIGNTLFWCNFYCVSKSEALCGNCPNMEFFWSAFSHIRTEYPYSFGIRQNTDQKKPHKVLIKSTNTSVPTVLRLRIHQLKKN